MNNRRNFYILLLIVFFAFVGAAIPYTIFAPLFLHPEHGGLIHLNWSNVTRGILLGTTLAMYPLGQFLGAPILGSLSDQVGRKKILAITLMGTAIGYAMTAIAINESSMRLLIISRLYTGFLGGNLAIAAAYIVDLKINKHKGFGAISAMAAFGYIFGPLLGGLLSNANLIKWFNYAVPFYTATIIGLLIAIIAGVMLTENHIKNENFNYKHLLKEFNFYRRFSNLRRNINLKWLLISGILLYLAIDTFYEFYPVILVHRWHFNATDIAIFNVVLALGLGIGNFFLPKLLTSYWKPTTAFCLNIIIFIISTFTFIITKYPIFLYLEFLIIGLSYGTSATMHSIFISDNASLQQQGEALGLSWGLRMLGDAIICLLGGFLIAVTTILPMLIALGSICTFLAAFYYLTRKLHLRYHLNNEQYD